MIDAVHGVAIQLRVERFIFTSKEGTEASDVHRLDQQKEA